MDYCSTCRRHLNGALVCPGCGAYAPDITPSVTGGRAVPGPVTTTALPGAEGGGGTGVTERVDTGAGALHAFDPGSAPDLDPVLGPVAASASGSAMSAPTGRAARRRQLARWKKTQRRALVATAVAFVGGGLTVVSMDRGSGDRAQAATAPEVTGMGGAKGPAEQYGDPAPAATPPGTHRSSPDRPARSASDDAPPPQSTGAASTPTIASDTRPDGATGAPTTAPPPRTTSPSTDSEAGAGSGSAGGAGADSGSGAATRPTSLPVAASGSGGGGDGGENRDGENGRPGGRSGSQPAAPDPSTPPADSPDTSRSELCLLVICLG